jgi:hypothetical protein
VSRYTGPVRDYRGQPVEPNIFDLHPMNVRRIESGRYWLFDVECPQPVMAAYEGLYVGAKVQQNGDRILAWVVTTVLVQGDTEFGGKLMTAMEKLGWRRPVA